MTKEDEKKKKDDFFFGLSKELPFFGKFFKPKSATTSKLRPPLASYSTYRIHLINGYISLHSCQILSPSQTGLIVSAHRLTNITLLTLIATL